MQILTKKIFLDMLTLYSQETIHVKKGDTAVRLIFCFSEHSKPFPLLHGRAVFVGKKPDGTYVFNDCDIVDGAAEYNVTAQTTALAGIVDCEVRLYGADDRLLTSPRFTMVVDETVYSADMIIDSSTEIDALTEIISEANTLIEDIESKRDNGDFNGEKGENGYTPIKGVDYFDGKDGITPVKGVDYFTEADKDEFLREIPSKMGKLEYEYNDTDNTCTVTGIGTYACSHLDIPSYIDGYIVTRIGVSAFNTLRFTRVVIPETVTHIGASAFTSCTITEGVTIKAKTPPVFEKTVIGFDPFWTLGEGNKFYVPAESIEDYKLASPYNADRFFPIGSGTGGADGITPHIGENGNWWIGNEDTGVRAAGERGEQGERGNDGRDGIDGYTPVKGVDYFTEADVAEIVARVLAQLPEGGGGTGGSTGGDTGGGDTDIVATLTEADFANGTDGSFLEAGQAYLANDTYFVATNETPSKYVAPPEGTVITTDGNEGTVGYNGSDWYVHWDNAPCDERTVTFRKTEIREDIGGDGGDTGGDNTGGDIVADVEATLENGVLTMRSGLDWVRWYEIAIWSHGQVYEEDAPSISMGTYEMIGCDPDHENYHALSVSLLSLFAMSEYGAPDDGSTVYIRVTADDDMHYPSTVLETVWYAPQMGEVVATLTESDLCNTNTGDFLEVGKAYYANDTYFVAVLGTGADCPAPPMDMVFKTDGNRGVVVWEGSGWCVSGWANAPSEERTVTFYKAEGGNTGGDTGGDTGGATKGELVCSATIDQTAMYLSDLGSLVADEQYYIEDTLFTAVDVAYIIPPIGTKFVGTDGREYEIYDLDPTREVLNLITTDSDAPTEGLVVHFYKAE